MEGAETETAKEDQPPATEDGAATAPTEDQPPVTTEEDEAEEPTTKDREDLRNQFNTKKVNFFLFFN